MRLANAAIMLVLLGGCASHRQSQPAVVRAPLIDASGSARGSAIVTGSAGAYLLRIEAAVLAPGLHGMHFHSVGRCETPSFASAGAHWNPAGHEHGLENPRGSHAGDLPNLSVDSDGRGVIEVPLGAIDIGGLLDEDGAALVIHAAPDDARSDPSGNSGARVLCASLTR